MKQVTQRQVNAAGAYRNYPKRADAAKMTTAQYVARFLKLNHYVPRSNKHDD